MSWFDFSYDQLWGAGKETPDSRYKKDDGTFLTPREAMQKVGTEVGRQIYSEVWVNRLVEDAKRVLNPDGLYKYDSMFGVLENRDGILCSGIVVPDVRFKNEVHALRARGCKIVLVKRPSSEPFPEDEAAASLHAHQSENDLLDLTDAYFDFVLYNDSTPHALALHVDTMLDVLKKKILPYDPKQEDIPPYKRS